MCSLVVSVLDSPAVDPRSYPGSGSALLMSEKSQVVYYISSCYMLIRGVPRIWEGGGQEFFFSDLGICMSRSDMLRMAKPCALLGGFGGMLPREIFLKRCNLVRFRVYFDQILSLFFSKMPFFI